ncbi:MAG: tRNA preQ1(34) S-adenosylmethionine ribosyltransferase-isomerase QueA [Planctomycetaceae bacterium]
MNSLEEFDYHLPEELIAKEPLPRRDSARLLVVDRQSGKLSHLQVKDLPGLLRAGDCLVVNDTKVVPARLYGERTATGGRWEGLFLEETESGSWRLLSSTRGKLQPGEQITLYCQPQNSSSEIRLTLRSREEDGIWTARMETDLSSWDVLNQCGTVPLPPYIGRAHPTEKDRDRYQTVYSQTPGAVAAPTAGLHFTPELLEACQSRGINRAAVTLHVGIGTFRPLSEESFRTGQLHSEWCEVSKQTAGRLNEVRKQGGKVVAVGTTSVRTLESTYRDRHYCAGALRTNLFIQPPYSFPAIDALMTNFHLPKSSLLVLVGALMGMDLMKHVYDVAIREKYRFYSYGDAMLIL